MEVIVPDRRVQNLLGRQIGVLTVVAYAGVSKHGKAMWTCRCECGQLRSVVGREMLIGNGMTRKCRCNGKRHNGKSSHRLYLTWLSMHHRCSNPKRRGYHRYGGRGIRVCERWNDFSLFIEDMGPAYPGEGWSIDRINNDGDCSPANCKWSTKNEQCSNTCRSRRFTYEGVTKTQSQWAEFLGVSEYCIRHNTRAYGETAALKRLHEKKGA